MNRTTATVAALVVILAGPAPQSARADAPPTSTESESSAGTGTQASDASRESAKNSRQQPALELARTLVQHDAQVRSVAFSPDGKRAVSAGFDGVVRLWDPESGEELRQHRKHLIQGEPQPIRKAIFSPDGSRILSAGEGGLMRSYDASSGENVVEYVGHEHNIWTAGYAPDGKHVVSGDHKGIVRLWDAQSGDLVWQFEQHKDIVYDLRFSPDGRLILSCSKDRSARLIEVSSGDQLRALDGYRNAVLCGAFSPDTKQILTMGYGDEHYVWDLESGGRLRQVTGVNAGVYDVEYLQNGLAIAAAKEGALLLIDPTIGQQVDVVRAHQGDVWSIAISREGPLVLSGSADGTATLWHLASSDVLLRKRHWAATLPSPSPVHALADCHSYAHEIAKLLRDEKFNELEERIADLRESKKQFASGHSYLDVFYWGTSRPEIDGNPADEDHRRQITLLERWKQAKPDSLAARIALAKSWRRYAWHARGTSWAYKIAPEDWKQFGERIEKAQEMLREVAEQQTEDPELYRTLIRLARDSGQPKARVHALLRKSAAADPTYWPSFHAAAHYLLPRWHGQPGDVEQLAIDGVKMTEEHLEGEVYIRVIEAARFYHGANVFQNFEFDWERARKGFLDALSRSPDSLFLLNRFCMSACYAGDRETAVDMFVRIQGRWDGQLWGDRSHFEQWHRWASPDYLDGEQQRVLTHHRGGVFGVAFSPDGAWLASGSSDDQLRLVRLGADEEDSYKMSHMESIYGVAFSPDGRHIVTGGRNGRLTLWDAATRLPVAMGEHDGLVEALKFSPDGRRLVSTTRSGTVKVWPAETLGAPQEIGAEFVKRGGMGVDVSPDSQHLTVVDGTGQLAVWHLESESLRWSRKAHSSYGTDVAFSPDGAVIATASGDKTVKLWNAEDGEPIVSLPAASLAVYDVEFSPDGSRIAGVTLANGDRNRPGELIVWDVASKQVLRKYSGHKGGVWSVAVSPDGQQIATGSYDMTVRLWEMPPLTSE